MKLAAKAYEWRGRISLVCLRCGTIKQEYPKLNLIEVKIQKYQDTRVGVHQTNFVFFIRTVYFSGWNVIIQKCRKRRAEGASWAGSCWGSGCQRLLESLFWPRAFTRIKHSHYSFLLFSSAVGGINSFVRSLSLMNSFVIYGGVSSLHR